MAKKITKQVKDSETKASVGQSKKKIPFDELAFELYAIELKKRVYSRTDRVTYKGPLRYALDLHNIIRYHELFEENHPTIDEVDKKHHRDLLNRCVVDCNETYELLEEINNPNNRRVDIGFILADVINKITRNSMELGGFNRVPEFHYDYKLQQSARNAGNLRLMKRKDPIDLRRKIIKSKYRGKYSLSKRCADNIIEKCSNEFINQGIKNYSWQTIMRDIKFIAYEGEIRTTLTE